MREGRLERRVGRRSLVSLSLALLAALCVALTVLALHHLFTSPHPGANDFYIPWRAVRELVIEGRNPYAPEVTRDIQQTLFGGPRPPGTHQYAFAYPLTVLPLLAPLAPLPYDWAEAIWLTLLLGALLSGVFLTVRAVNWSPRTSMLAGLAVWSILFYPATRGVFLGQIAVIVFLLTAMTLFFLCSGHWTWAGAFLALTTMKPQMVTLVVPLLAAWSFRRRKWRFVGGFLATLVVMFIIPMLWLPTWPLDFVGSVRAYAGYTENTAPVRVLLSSTGLSSRWPEVVVSGSLCLFLATEVWRSAKRGWDNLLPLVALAIVIELLILPRTATTNQVLLIIPMLWWANEVRHNPFGSLASGLILLALLTGGWALFLTTTHGAGSESLLMYAPFPWVALLLTIPWLRKKGGCSEF